MSRCICGTGPREKPLAKRLQSQRTIVHGDHKPLEMIVKKPLHKSPRRPQELLLRLLQYDTEVTYHKGEEMYIADTLSRAYLPHSGGTDNFCAVNAVRHLPISTERMEMLKACTDREGRDIADVETCDTAMLARVET